MTNLIQLDIIESLNIRCMQANEMDIDQLISYQILTGRQATGAEVQEWILAYHKDKK